MSPLARVSLSVVLLSASVAVHTRATPMGPAAGQPPTVTLTVRDFVEATPIGCAKVRMFAGAVPFASGITNGDGVFVGTGAPLNQAVRVEWIQIGYVRAPEATTLTVPNDKAVVDKATDKAAGKSDKATSTAKPATAKPATTKPSSSVPDGAMPW